MACANSMVEFTDFSRIGRRQRAGPSYSIHLQCAASVPHILAHFCDYGCPVIRRKIFQGNAKPMFNYLVIY